MIFSLPCLLFYSARMKNFSRISVERMNLVFYDWVSKVILFNPSVSERIMAGLICKILLLQNVDNSIIYFC